MQSSCKKQHLAFTSSASGLSSSVPIGIYLVSIFSVLVLNQLSFSLAFAETDSPQQCEEPAAPTLLETLQTKGGEDATSAPVGEEKKEVPPKPVERKEEEGGPYIFDVLHGTLSKGVTATATWLDSFFGDERYELEQNKTLVKVRYDVFRETRSQWERRPEMSVKLALPQFQKTTRLIITGNPSEDFEGAAAGTGIAGENAAKPQVKPQEKQITTALQYFFTSTDRVNSSMRIGVRFHEGSPALFVGPRYRILCPLCPFEPWMMRFTQEVFWWTDLGWQANTRLDFERQLPHDFFLRMSVDGAWLEDVNGYIYSFSCVLRQPLDSFRALNYEWINNFQTSPVHELEEMAFIVRYRQRILRDWLFFEIAPQARYPRERSFDFTPGILFRLEAVFGKY